MTGVRSQEILCAPAGLLPAEQLEYWRTLAHALYEAAKPIDLRAAASVTPSPHDYRAVHLAVARAEGRS